MFHSFSRFPRTFNECVSNSLGLISKDDNASTAPVTHAAYSVLDSSWLQEYDARLTLYKHMSTGAEFLAFIPNTTKSTSTGEGGYNPKPDKVFGISFRTKPEKNNGVAHILERECFCYHL